MFIIFIISLFLFLFFYYFIIFIILSYLGYAKILTNVLSSLASNGLKRGLLSRRNLGTDPFISILMILKWVGVVETGGAGWVSWHDGGVWCGVDRAISAVEIGDMVLGQ